MLTYQQNLLRERVRTWLGTLFLATVGMWAGLVVWQTATGENAVVQAFTIVVEQRTVQED